MRAPGTKRVQRRGNEMQPRAPKELPRRRPRQIAPAGAPRDAARAPPDLLTCSPADLLCALGAAHAYTCAAARRGAKRKGGRSGPRPPVHGPCLARGRYRRLACARAGSDTWRAQRRRRAPWSQARGRRRCAALMGLWWVAVCGARGIARGAKGEGGVAPCGNDWACELISGHNMAAPRDESWDGAVMLR